MLKLFINDIFINLEEKH